MENLRIMEDDTTNVAGNFVFSLVPSDTLVGVYYYVL